MVDLKRGEEGPVVQDCNLIPHACRWAFSYSPSGSRTRQLPLMRQTLFARLDVSLAEQGLESMRNKFSLIIMPQVRWGGP